MSRGIRDLRDLICVSRLSGRESDDDLVFSDSDFNTVPSDSPCSDKDSFFKRKKDDISPDSGVVTNGSQHSVSEILLEKPGKKVSKKKHKQKALSLFPTRHEFPKSEPLPPVQSPLLQDFRSESTEASAKPTLRKRVNFDDMMCYMDATIVSSWLTKVNELVNHLAEFCHTGDNYVQFAHFWLTDFMDVQKHEIFNMEFEIFIDEVTLAFSVGREQGKVLRTDIMQLASALFLEYPSKLLGAESPYLFLDYLDILSSEKKDKYKNLLSNVRCSTNNRQYAQWLLATRCYALVSVWSAITNFYRNLTGRQTPVSGVPLPLNISRLTVAYKRLYHAISLGFVDVVHFFISRDLVKADHRDSHNRTLLFTAVMLNQHKIVEYLLSNADVRVNEAADTGNTPLHAAANSGNLTVVKELLKCPLIEVDATNSQCENATPLHIAVLHGHRHIVDALLRAKASRSTKMGDLTAIDIAKDFGKFQILESLKKTAF